MTERPTGVTVLAILEFIAGIFTLSGAAIIIGIVPWVGALSIVVGIFALVVGGLLWIGKGYWVLIALLIFGIVSNLSFVFLGGGFRSIFAVVIGFVILYYLTRPHVKKFFKRQERSLQGIF